MSGVILADRDTRYAAILRRRFELGGVPFSFLSDGRLLTSMVRELNPSVILCSLRVDCSDGFDVVQRIHEDQELREIPCIVLTDLAEDVDIRRCRALGCVAYFIKRHTKPEYLFSYIQHCGYLTS